MYAISDGSLLVACGAVCSDDGAYRYRLWRRWDPDEPVMLFVMCNPSTADASADDPTIRRCAGFARRERCGGIDVVNLFALRATEPRRLLSHPDPGGRDNAAAWRSAWDQNPGATVVAAWGAAPFSRFPGWRAPFSVLTERERCGWWCLGTTRRGSPRHPLFVPGSQQLERWS